VDHVLLIVGVEIIVLGRVVLMDGRGKIIVLGRVVLMDGRGNNVSCNVVNNNISNIKSKSKVKKKKRSSSR